ncbi:MAG: hypothetical protein HRU09_18185 [Oligoflexales bacterium]|nr:hypothetical protein [Oligoflexales bacterium]
MGRTFIWSYLSTFSALSAYGKPTSIGFRVLLSENEVIQECSLTIESNTNQGLPTDLRSLSMRGFSELGLHADWDPVNKLFSHVAGKPWLWCYHIYDRTEQMEALGIEWQDYKYALNQKKCLSDFDQTLVAGELIEWVPCEHFKIDI